MTAQTPPKENPPSPRIPWLYWWLIFLALFVWNIFTLWPKVVPEIEIPYTAFVDQVKADNVSQLKITGDEITGQFVKPIIWPQQDTTDAKPASPQPTAAPDTSAYSEFRHGTKTSYSTLTIE